MRKLAMVCVGSIVGACASRAPTKQELQDEWKRVQWMSYRYPVWAEAHPDEQCPKSLDEIAASWRPRKGTRDTGVADRWGGPLRWWCGDDAPAEARSGFLAVASAGPDGKFDTPDDLVSWREPEP